MNDIFIKNTYSIFEGYNLNTSKSIIRYEFESDKPIVCNICKNRMKYCSCGSHVIPFAYKFKNSYNESPLLMGKKCTKCGLEFFTQKTISLFPSAFIIEDNDVFSEKNENIENNIQVECTSNYIKNVKADVFKVYEKIILLSYENGFNLFKEIQNISMQIEELNNNKEFEFEPKGYDGLLFIQCISDKLEITPNQLFIPDSKLKNRVIKDIISIAKTMIETSDFDFDNESCDDVIISFEVKKRNKYCAELDFKTYCTECTKYPTTANNINEEKVYSKYNILLCKKGENYSIYLSYPPMPSCLNKYFYEVFEIYIEQEGELADLIQKCIQMKIDEDLHKNDVTNIEEHSSNNSGQNDISNSSSKNNIPLETKGRNLEQTKISDKNETELIAKVYNTTHTMDILNEFEGLVGEKKPYKRLVISNGIRRSIYNNIYYIHYVIERGKNKDFVGDITFTNFKQGYVSKLNEHVSEELSQINIDNFLDMDIFVKFKKPFRLRAQNKLNRTGYGWEWDWSGGHGDYVEGTLYGETTDYIFAGVYISTDHIYDPKKRKEKSKIENNCIKILADGYIKGEYSLVVYSNSKLPKSNNKRIQLFVKMQRGKKDKYIPVAYDNVQKKLYINQKTYEYYRTEINNQKSIFFYKNYLQ